MECVRGLCFGKDDNIKTAWGYSFKWTADHLDAEDMEGLKHSYDQLADTSLDRLDQLNRLPDNKPIVRQDIYSEETAPESKPTKRDVYTLLRDHAGTDKQLGLLWHQANTIPDWVDWEQISRGQEVFYRYGGPMLTALAYQSLLGGMGASRIVETLARTGGFGVKVARRRLMETTQWILQITRSLESIKPGGAGHIASIRVRLLHAAVRRRIMTISKENPGYYDVQALGVPINDLDSIATISTFSSALIWLGLPRQGIWLRKQEISDFLALWRLVSHYIGSPADYFESPDRAKHVMESLILSDVNPNAMSKVLANNIISCLQDQPPTYASREFLIANVQWLNGRALANALGFERTSLYHMTLVAGPLDRRKIKALRRIFYAVIVENKTHGLGAETLFEFEFIPDVQFITRREATAASQRGRKQSLIERRSLRALLITATVGSIVILWLIKAFLDLVVRVFKDWTTSL